MPGRIEYKRPRKINVISVSLTLTALAVGYVGYQFFPMVLAKQEAYRVLEETSSAFALKYDLYAENPDKLQTLKNKMSAGLRLAGVQDPAMEIWIEPGEGENYRFGVLYSAWFEWPFDLLQRNEFVTQVEHVLEH